MSEFTAVIEAKQTQIAQLQSEVDTLQRATSIPGRRADADVTIRRCSFCNKAQNDVRKLIAGPTVFICDECVEVCSDILADVNLDENRAAPPAVAQPTTKPRRRESQAATAIGLHSR